MTVKRNVTERHELPTTPGQNLNKKNNIDIALNYINTNHRNQDQVKVRKPPVGSTE